MRRVYHVDFIMIHSLNMQTTEEVEQELDDIKLMASGIGITTTAMPIQMIHCSQLLATFLQNHPMYINHILDFALNNCGDQYYTRTTIAKALTQLTNLSEAIEKIVLWQNNEKEEFILNDLKKIKVN